MNVSGKQFAWVLSVFLCVSGSTVAQLDNASILGTVFDSSGAAIPGAKVSIQNMGTSATVEIVTDANGNFVAPVLPVGTYRITVSVSGFKTHIQEGIPLSVADRIKLSIVLTPGEITQEITVQSDAPLVQTASATTGGVVGTQLAEDLPLNGRAIEDLMVLIPGSVVLGGPAINGGSDGRLFQPGLKYLVDGGDSSQIDSDFSYGGYQSAARITRLSVDALDEFRMVTGLGSAEYGQSTGTVVNFISKSGTNEFHGSLFEFFRNEKLDSRNYFNKPPDRKPPFRLNQFGGSLGGRIVRDKLFFFGTYEGVRQRLGVAQVALVFTQAFRDTLAPELQPVAAQMPLPNGPVSQTEPRVAQFSRAVSNELKEDTWTWKIDYLPTSKDRISFRHSGSDSFTKTYFGVSQDQFRPIPSVKHLAKLSYTRTISPRLLNEASLALNRLSPDTRSAGSDAVRNFPQVTFTLGGAVTFGQGGELGTVGPATFDLLTDNTAYQIYDTLSWVKGRHQLKYGTQIVRNQDNKAVLPQRFVYFLNIDGFAANAPFGVQTYGWPRVGMRGTYYAGFVQDDIQVNKSLTINAGLRYQYDTNPTESHGRVANFDPTTGTLDPRGTPMMKMPKTNFGPRFGFAFAPTESKRTVFRGGFGLYFANLNPALPQFIPANLLDVGQNRFLLFPSSGFPFPDISSAVGAQALFAQQRDWQGSYTEQWNFNIQQAVGQTMTLEVGYVGNRGLHLLPSGLGQELNPVNPATGQRRYPSFSTITNELPALNSNYNALQVSFGRRLANRLSFGTHYTWSHSFDENTLTFAPAAQNPDDLRGEYGPADYDVRHNLVFYYSYQLPAAPGLPGWLGEGWQVNGITGMRSGFPVNVVCGCDSRGIGAATGRPNIVPGVSLRPANLDFPSNQVNRNAFSTPAPGTFGNAGRNLLSGPSAYNWDFSLLKSFQVKEHQSLKFRAEMFNIFNTPQFANPVGNLASPAFGGTFATIGTGSGFGSNRQIQFALKYLF